MKKNRIIRLTMAQALLKFLDNQFVSRDGEEHKFVRGIMGIFGHGNVTGIGEALEYSDHKLEYIRGCNEQGIVHAATAYAKQKNRLGIWACTSSIGPGATNLVTGAATATINRLPVLLLPGDTFACRQPDPVLQQLENEEDYTLTVNDCLKPVSKYWDRIVRPEQLMNAMLNAMRVLTDPANTGAVTICLPQDVQTEAYDYPESFFRKRIHYIDRQPVNDRAISEALEELTQSKTPLIIAGGGVHYSEATAELTAFAEMFGIPVAETQAGKSAIPWDHPLSVGGMGVTGTLAANSLAEDADCVLAIGTRLNDFVTMSKRLTHHPFVRIIHLNVNRMDGLKLDGIALQGDARLGLQTLKTELKKARYKTSKSYLEKIADLKAEWNDEVDKLFNRRLKDGYAQTAVIGTLNNFMPDDAILISSAGSLPGDLHRLWRPKQPKTYHVEYGYACMGYEVAAGLGVKLAEPNREVYVLISDGSFLMLNSEFLTAIQENVKINILVLDNNGSIHNHNLQLNYGSLGYGNERRFRNPKSAQLDGAFIPVDFAKYGEALGALTFTAQNAEDLQAALTHASKVAESTLIDVKVKPGTMSNGYLSWWRVGVAEVSEANEVQKASADMKRQLENVRPY